jgi:uncharacterized membrane protein YdjX (TVP38/TMEM64 family)
MGMSALALFAVGMLLARRFAAPIEQMLSEHTHLGVLVFVGTSVVAVLMPVLTNLPLVPLAVLAWGPWWTASLLLAGWVVGAALSFALGRHGRESIVQRFPSLQRYTNIDRWIDPQHRLLSLIVLRMTFPVDVLSYALGLFSRSTTLLENSVSTGLGAAPFALLFALFPVLPATAQWAVFGASTLAFAVYLRWILRSPNAAAGAQR